MNSLELLQQSPIFENIATPQLEWLIENGICEDYAIDDFLFKPGQSIDYLTIILSGSFTVYVQRENSRKELGNFEVGEVTGLLPYSRMKESSGYGIARKPSSVLRLHRDKFPDLIEKNYELTEALVHVMLNRTRDFTTLRIQDEKMMALGKLSAGLAHELNNPISAIVRNASGLKKHLGYVPDAFKKVISIKVTNEQVDTINKMLFERIAQGVKLDLSLMEKTEREDDCIDWLEDHGFEEVEENAELLTEFGIIPEDLDRILDDVGEDNILGVLSWCFNVMATEKLVLEIQEASKRVADLISSIKEYSFMDRSQDKQAVNLHHGIRNSVTMLGHKFRRNKVTFIENFHPEMPKMHGFPGELNQVFTNLIDNALDAMEETGGGNLEIKSEFDDNFAKIYIIDSGSGIPEDVQHRIFEPFFTTKEMGKGTGLGLEVVRKIIQQHRGDIQLKSVPGRTEFLVCLPLGD